MDESNYKDFDPLEKVEPLEVAEEEEEEIIDESRSEYIDADINFCISNIHTTNPMQYFDILNKMVNTLNLKKEEASKIYMTSDIFSMLMQNIDFANENLCITTLQVYRLLFEYQQEINSFIQEDFISFLININESHSIPILYHTLDIANCIAETDFNAVISLSKYGFIRNFVQFFGEFIKVEISEEIQSLFNDCCIKGASFIEIIFSYKQFLPEEELLRPLVEMLFTLLHMDEYEIIHAVLDAFLTILDVHQELMWKFFVNKIVTMIDFIRSFSSTRCQMERKEDLVNAMIDVLFFGLYHDNSEYVDIHSSGLIPLLNQLCKTDEHANPIYFESCGNLLHTLLEDKYIAGEDLRFIHEYLKLVDLDMPLAIKLICAKMFKTLASFYKKYIISYLQDHMEFLIVLCTIINTDDWDVRYNVFSGFNDIISFARERGLDISFLLEAFEDNDITPEFIESLIEDSENLEDEEINDTLQQFHRIMMDEDDDAIYDPHYAPNEGYEFGLDE